MFSHEKNVLLTIFRRDLCRSHHARQSSDSWDSGHVYHYSDCNWWISVLLQAPSGQVEEYENVLRECLSVMPKKSLTEYRKECKKLKYENKLFVDFIVVAVCSE